jgi:hypothetical protein
MIDDEACWHAPHAWSTPYGERRVINNIVHLDVSIN